MSKENGLIIVRAKEGLEGALQSSLGVEGYGVYVLGRMEGFPEDFEDLEENVVGAVIWYNFLRTPEAAEVSRVLCSELEERGIPFVIIGSGPIPKEFQKHILELGSNFFERLMKALFGEQRR